MTNYQQKQFDDDDFLDLSIEDFDSISSNSQPIEIEENEILTTKGPESFIPEADIFEDLESFDSFDMFLNQDEENQIQNTEQLDVSISEDLSIDDMNSILLGVSDHHHLSEPEAQVEVEPEAEAQVEAEPEAEPEAQVEVQVEVQAEPEAEAQVEAEPEAQVEVQAEPEPEAQVEVQAEPEPEPEAEAEAQVEVQAEPEPEAQVEAEPEPEPEVIQPQPIPAEEVTQQPSAIHTNAYPILDTQEIEQVQNVIHFEPIQIAQQVENQKQSHYEEVYQAYIDLYRTLEPSKSLPSQKTFFKQLNDARDLYIAENKCTEIVFDVYNKKGKAAIKAKPAPSNP
jgi:hypothetical protein